MKELVLSYAIADETGLQVLEFSTISYANMICTSMNCESQNHFYHVEPVEHEVEVEK